MHFLIILYFTMNPIFGCAVYFKDFVCLYCKKSTSELTKIPITLHFFFFTADLLLCVHACGLYDGHTVWRHFYCGWTNWHETLSKWVCGLWETICSEDQQTQWPWWNHRRWKTMDLCEYSTWSQVECAGNIYCNSQMEEKQRYTTESKLMWLGCFLFQVRSEIITTYALCGFANFSSLGIMIGALCELFFLSWFLMTNQLLSQYWLLTQCMFLSQSLHVPLQKKWNIISGVESYAHCHLCISCQCLCCR